jgi:hypothetical protein
MRLSKLPPDKAPSAPSVTTTPPREGSSEAAWSAFCESLLVRLLVVTAYASLVLAEVSDKKFSFRPPTSAGRARTRGEKTSPNLPERGQGGGAPLDVAGEDRSSGDVAPTFAHNNYPDASRGQEGDAEGEDETSGRPRSRDVKGFFRDQRRKSASAARPYHTKNSVSGDGGMLGGGRAES